MDAFEFGKVRPTQEQYNCPGTSLPCDVKMYLLMKEYERNMEAGRFRPVSSIVSLQQAIYSLTAGTYGLN